MDARSHARAAAEARPPHASASPPTQTLRVRRRTSLPSTPARPLAVDTARKHRASHHVRSHAASPELIASLIDQLAAISASTQHHFEPQRPFEPSTARPSEPPGHARSPDRAYASALRTLNDGFPDDACEPPVIRTAPPPSGLSAITAPKRTKPPGFAYAGRSSSAASLHSCTSHRSSHSFGAISIEAGPKPVASARSSVESKRSVKRPRSLMYMGSRERLKLKEERRRGEDGEVEVRKLTQQAFAYEDTIKEEGSHFEGHLDNDPDPFVIAEAFATRHPSRSSSPALRVRMNLVDDAPEPLVPDRGSSLRHASPSKKSKRRKGKGKEVERPSTVAGPPEEPLLSPDEARRQTLLLELEQDDDEVAQRIKQLREQKLLRAKIAGDAPDRPASAEPGGRPSVSGRRSPAPSASSALDRRPQNSTKAHKLLGIAAPARSSSDSNMNKPLPSEPTRPAPLPPHLRHARHRSLTVNDGDDLPLPINYALALKALDAAADSPRTPRVDSTHIPVDSHIHVDSHKHIPLPPPAVVSAPANPSTTASTPSTPSDGVKRSTSLSVSGRSAFARRANSMTASVTRSHRHSASLTEERPPACRSASEEVATGRHSSLSMASNSFSLQHKKTKKQRWSHPDLPAKAEKKHNDKVDAAEAKLRATDSRLSHYPINPWAPVIEERPTSLDSVDMDVDAYLHAPRLSQKIRHPQTGRLISFSEVGDPNGYAVFVCVGMGLTRFVMAFYDQLAATLKLRLITPERPGVAGSQVDPTGTPMTWPDDILIICQALKITKFSLLAHSAGAIYALATALRMPQHIRGRVHLLAPWIPPSQMSPVGLGRDSPPTQQLPRSQRFLRALPPSLLRVANSTFLSNTSASLHRTAPPKPPKPSRKTSAPQMAREPAPATRPALKENRRESMLAMDQIQPASTLSLPLASDAQQEARNEAHALRTRTFDTRLTFAIWARATLNANPATDLIVCLETKQPIGFRYEDITRPVVVHHGSKDSRVPVENVRWLGKVMRRCEVRVLEGEGHGLMASAGVMGGVLMEIAGEWGEWADATTSLHRNTVDSEEAELSASGFDGVGLEQHARQQQQQQQQHGG
ncbi:hypothetical protein C7974DRAFT_368559 [Boeremia exigua]|uniref:uncharacterized protein n=1 Tax=Boeremia exigua TaxID=749465 RepID=UPI001E8CB614|nr:uncharacterized protein C7974DRAFT_368559 [Boeremia exigua]KAH6614274.1 hypothetical protein C7974DRAFT_368559 [Boeremia exigua]